MWHWDQGRLEYFQFDVLRQIAKFVQSHDVKDIDRQSLVDSIGLPFSPSKYRPWRNYSRPMKLSLLVSELDGRAVPTPVAHLLAQAGAVTCDEYAHFLARAFTEPSPALKNWNPSATFRYPLLFALKYLLTKAATTPNPDASLLEIVGAYERTGFDGSEEQVQFVTATSEIELNEAAGQAIPSEERRQAQESLRVIAQISYLHIREKRIFVSLDGEDALAIFQDLAPIIGPRETDPDAEIRRLAALFRDGSTEIVFDFPHTVVGDVEESGFIEGSKVKKTHLVIERNAGLRREFFAARPAATCDLCTLETARTYPWSQRVLDLHHLLPLSSGTRVDMNGTTFDDLVPVCPTCHRAIHRFYDQWLTTIARKDFANREEAKGVYLQVKQNFPGTFYATR